MLTKEVNELISRVGPGTYMGELMRQYWIPAVMSSELPAPNGPPMRLRLLGEDLIAFRDTSGRVGVLRHNCPHRGASLFLRTQRRRWTALPLPRLEVRRHRPVRGYALRAAGGRTSRLR